jgi:hypothetical protein
MRSEIKKYDLYKAGEYIPNSSQTELEYYKLIDEISDIELRKKLLRKIDKLNERQNLKLIFGLFLYLICGFVLGFAIGMQYYITS